MSTRPEDLLRSARKQCMGDHEADWRSAVGTCYYACFHALKEWHCSLPGVGSMGQAVGEHEQLIQQLLNPSKKCTLNQERLSRFFSKELSDLRGFRAIADYKLEESVTQVWAENAILRAQGIFDAIAAYQRK